MNKPKIWKIKGYEGSFSDDELIALIRNGQVLGSFKITTKELKDWIKVKDSIYQFYIKGDEEDETI
ncbi:MAG: DUF4339 domain-containing protein [Erysipelotrichaceae bacterium]|nr:DUF4339 domain-containing protein [Erysipelotrichaceae bacterium]